MTSSRPPTRTPAPQISDHPSAPLAVLAAVDRDHPDARKLLLGPPLNYGRELLFAHARRTGGWIGWEAATLRGIAGELAFTALGKRDAGSAPTWRSAPW